MASSSNLKLSEESDLYGKPSKGQAFQSLNSSIGIANTSSFELLLTGAASCFIAGGASGLSPDWGNSLNGLNHGSCASFCGLVRIMNNTGHFFFNDLMSLNGSGTLLDSVCVCHPCTGAMLPGCLTSLYWLTRPSQTERSIHHMPYILHRCT